MCRGTAGRIPGAWSRARAARASREGVFGYGRRVREPPKIAIRSSSSSVRHGLAEIVERGRYLGAP